jgi:ABC-type multidrug transport system ATPase subunit
MASHVAAVRGRSETVSTRTAAIATAGLMKDFSGAHALGPLDLVVPAGQRVSLVGHNGSGKTTLIRLLTGMLEPSAGSASVAGHPTGSIAARSALAHLADQPVFYDDLSVREHLEYIARLHGRADWEQRAGELLDAVGLTDRADELPSTFSRGLRQKAAVCLALVRPFEVMVVDEPFVGLDRAGRDAVLELFRAAHGDGAALVIATHELATVVESERIVALRDGALVFDGRPGEADLDELVDIAPSPRTGPD